MSDAAGAFNDYGDEDGELARHTAVFRRVAARRKAEAAARAAAADARFCRTPGATAILGVIEIAMELGRMGAVIGAPGVGKTTTLEWCAEREAGICYSVMAPGKSSMSAMLSRVCEALGAMGGSGSSDLHDIICNAIEWNRVRALLIDEAQFVNDRNLDELRCIHDETGVALVFAGNAGLRSRFNKTRTADFAQFTSRIGPRVELEAPMPGDVAALAQHAGTDDPKAVAWLERHAVGDAGLRQVAELLKTGRKLAGEGNIKLTHLKQAAVAMEVGKE